MIPNAEMHHLYYSGPQQQSGFGIPTTGVRLPPCKENLVHNDDEGSSSSDKSDEDTRSTTSKDTQKENKLESLVYDDSSDEEERSLNVVETLARSIINENVKSLKRKVARRTECNTKRLKTVIKEVMPMLMKNLAS